jgi:hypothetical protein
MLVFQKQEQHSASKMMRRRMIVKKKKEKEPNPTTPLSVTDATQLKITARESAVRQGRGRKQET